MTAQTHEARGRLLVGADGRTSQVREAVGVPLHQDTAAPLVRRAC